MSTRPKLRLGVSTLLGAALLSPVLVAGSASVAGATTFDPQVTIPITQIHSPYGVVVDGTGVVTATTYSDGVDIAAGVAQKGAGAETTLDFGDVGGPFGIARDAAGNLYVSDASSDVVLKRAASDGTVTTLSIDGLTFPTGVAVDADGNVYVADSDNGRIVKEPADGGAQSDVAFTGLDTPYGVAVDAAGTVYVADLGANKIVKRTSGGTQSTLGFTGLSSPDGIAVDADGLVYVSDADNDRVVTLPSAGGTQATLGFSGLSGPGGIAVSSKGSVYVADSGNDRIVELPVPGNTAKQSFVIATYNDYIQRNPTPTELSAGVASISDVTVVAKRAAFAKTLANTDIYLGAFVNKLYQDTLGRNGDAGGVAYWTKKLRNKVQTPAQVSANFYASSEYFRGFGNNTNATWVKDLYAKVLLRPATAAETTAGVKTTVAKGRYAFAYALFQNLESRKVRVKALYQRFLGRGPDPSGLNYWAGKVEVQGDIALAFNLSSSNEYFNKSAIRYP